jgi:hypothetical protein
MSFAEVATEQPGFVTAAVIDEHDLEILIA